MPDFYIRYFTIDVKVDAVLVLIIIDVKKKKFICTSSSSIITKNIKY